MSGRLHPGGAGRARWATSYGRTSPSGAASAFDELLLAASTALEQDAALALRASELAALVPLAGADARRDASLLILALLVAVERGSTRLGVAGAAASELARLLAEMALPPLLSERVLALGARLVAPGALAAGPPLAPLVVRPSDPGPIVAFGDHLYSRRLFDTEGRIASAIATRLRVLATSAPDAGVPRALRDVLAAPAFAGERAIRLSVEQQGAVCVAAHAPLALISGGPGTGKTSIVVSLLRVLARLGYDADTDVALAAPTGKAADRMRASIAGALRALREPTFDDVALLRTPPRSQTLHRLLGFSPRTGRYRAHERSPLGARVVIVDEASMIDVVMMDRLLRALGPGTRLVLLGDADQLPSVDAGAVFRDLCALGSEGVVRLTQSYRMDAGDPAGRNILRVAQAVHRGVPAPLFQLAPAAVDSMPADGSGDPSLGEGITPRAHASQIRFVGCEWVEAEGPQARAALLARWGQAYLDPLTRAARALGATFTLEDGRPPAVADTALHALFAHLERAKLLALTRAGALGVERVNEHFHALRTRRARATYVVGEPVMVHRNDYVRGLFNGDTGVVVEACVEGERGARRVVLFRRDDGFMGYPLGAVADAVELAYAITVHKAQGSEYDAVAVLLPDVETPLLTREILYTAITRSRRSVTLVGPRWAIEASVGRQVARSSGLRERVARDLGAET